MQNTNIPSDVELPSTGKLIKSTILAALAAIVILVTVVLPAEYGMDPTGIGSLLGLQKMGAIKVSLAKEAAAATALELEQSKVESSNAPATETGQPAVNGVNGILTHEMKVTLDPDESTEIKLKMVKGKQAKYVWWTDGGPAIFEMHGDSKELYIPSHRYSRGYKKKNEGILKAAFNGNHGWFWKNRTPETFTITLQTSGEYIDIKHLD